MRKARTRLLEQGTQNAVACSKLDLFRCLLHCLRQKAMQTTLDGRGHEHPGS